MHYLVGLYHPRLKVQVHLLFEDSKGARVVCKPALRDTSVQSVLPLHRVTAFLSLLGLKEPVKVNTKLVNDNIKEVMFSAVPSVERGSLPDLRKHKHKRWSVRSCVVLLDSTRALCELLLFCTSDLLCRDVPSFQH